MRLVVLGLLVAYAIPLLISAVAQAGCSVQMGAAFAKGGDDGGGNSGPGGGGGNSGPGGGGGNSGPGGGDDGDHGGDDGDADGDGDDGGYDGDDGDSDSDGDDGGDDGGGYDGAQGDVSGGEGGQASVARASRSRASGARQIGITSRGIAVVYNDGASAEIRQGRYAYREPSGRIAVQRAATGADIALMKSIAQGLSVRGIGPRNGDTTRVTRIERSGSRTRVEYSNGWSEEIRGGQYTLYDDFGRFVVSRPASGTDRARLGRYGR